MLYNELTNIKEFNNCVSKINKWYNKKVKLLTVITNPYNSNLIFLDLVEKLLKENKKILYIWGYNGINKKIINELKTKKINFNYSFMDGKEGKENLVFSNFDNVNKIKNGYDLCIIDDISTYSIVSKEKLRGYVEYLYLYSNRIIVFSIEKIINMGSTLNLSELRRKKPFIEPRIITTRVKLDEDMPYMLYDYFLWFDENLKKVIVFLPTEEKVNKVYKYYMENLKTTNIKMIKFSKRDTYKKINSFYETKNKSVFIITNNIGDYIKDRINVSVVVLFSDDMVFDYKKIIYFCFEAGENIQNDGINEVLLVSKEISKDMEKAKNIIRGYNKQIWEKE